MKFKKPTRAWINSYSKNSPYYKHHGKCGIVHQTMGFQGDIETIIYFTEGPVYSMQINPRFLETLNSQSNNLRI